MARYQSYIQELEALHGWSGVDLVHNCFLMGEEVGELFKAVRKYESLFSDARVGSVGDAGSAKTEVAEELVDVFNYLLAIANRLDIDLEAAFREKNEVNQGRRWT
ncbi:MAG: MazG nucleotide pyrophosphohydrolase domain-containing protein [Myxococcota bacterium]